MVPLARSAFDLVSIPIAIAVASFGFLVLSNQTLHCFGDRGRGNHLNLAAHLSLFGALQGVGCVRYKSYAMSNGKSDSDFQLSTPWR